MNPIEVTLSPEAQNELGALHDTLLAYEVASKKSLADILHSKAYDVRVQLFRGYWAQRYRGTRKGSAESKGVAFSQMRQRARQGSGISLRGAIVPGAKAPIEYYQRRKLRGAHGTTRRLRVPISMSTYQRNVWTELARRQQGVGVLGVAFLMQRWKKNVAPTSPRQVFEQTDYHRKVLGRATLSPSAASIEGLVPGQTEISSRYGILAAALKNVRQDTEVYLSKHLGGSWSQIAQQHRLNTK